MRGSVVCVSPDGTTTADAAMPYLPVRTDHGDAVTDCNGEFAIPVSDGSPLSDGTVNVGFSYEQDVPGPGGAVTRLAVMDDVEVAWGTGAFHIGFDQTVAAATTEGADGSTVLELDPVRIATSECEIWRIGAEVLDDFATGSWVPRGSRSPPPTSSGWRT